MLDAEPEIVEELKAANQRFYDAFNELSLERMDDIWEDSERVMCVHPGWPPLVGWQPVRDSWQRIFENANMMQFNIRYLNVVVHGDFGYVTCREGITSVVQGKATSFSTYATNIFAHSETGWLMVAHHASPGS
jgi:ketosteroid isomerase-like protein